MSANVPDFIRSLCQAKVRTACNSKQTQRGTISLFAIVLARMPLWGFGTFTASNMTTGTNYFNGEMFKTSQAKASPQPAFSYNSVWPYVYNTLTETWTETHGGSQTCVTEYSQFADIVQTVSGPTPSGAFVGDGTITSFTVTDALITVNYMFTLYLNPANPIQGTNFSGTYTGQLSGSILNPTGAGPFAPGDPTYGWAAMTSLANALLGHGTIPAFAGGSHWVTVDPISTSPFYRVSNNDYNSPTLWEFILAAANGFPSTPSFCQAQFMPPSIVDWPVPSINSQPTGAYINQGSCLSVKSTWQLNGAGWGNNTFDPGINNPPSMGGLGQVMNDHANIFAQQLNIAFFNDVGFVAPASTFPNPIAWPQTITFNPSDVTANIGSGNYGMLGFQAVPAYTHLSADATTETADSTSFSADQQ